MLQREYSLRPRGLLKNNTTSYDEDLLAAPPSTGLRVSTRRVPSSTKRGITGAAASASTVESANDYVSKIRYEFLLTLKIYLSVYG